MPGDPPFRASHYVIHHSASGASEIELRLTARDEAELFGQALAEMAPWARLWTGRERMTHFLSKSNKTKRCFTILHDERRAGVIVVIFPWLAGPYLNLLAVLPDHQRKGIGRAALAWLEEEAIAGGARNSFLCVSAFNEAAITFYKRCGYCKATLLNDLIKDGEDEILMRKRFG